MQNSALSYSYEGDGTENNINMTKTISNS